MQGKPLPGTPVASKYVHLALGRLWATNFEGQSHTQCPGAFSDKRKIVPHVSRLHDGASTRGLRSRWKITLISQGGSAVESLADTG